MKRLHPRLARLLLPLAALLAVAVLITLGAKYRAGRNTPGSETSAPGSGASQADYTAISYWNGNTTLSFAVNENGVWTWVDDPDFPLDPTDILATAELLAALTPQQTLENPENLETYGLDDPSATLSAIAGDTSKLTLRFGKATTDGKSYYVLMNGAETPVYTVDGGLLGQMNKGVYEMMALPAMPAMTADTVETAVFSAGEKQTTLTAVREKDEKGNLVPKGTLSWQLDGQSAGTRAEDALAELAELQVIRCVDFKPSAHAASLCGFDAPAAKLVVTYRTEAGTEQTLTLLFGKAAPSGEGRYLRMNEDSTIYLVPTEKIDALLPAAINGFPPAG